MAEKTNKSIVVGVRLTDAQHTPFVEPIALSGLKPAQYFRDLVLSRSPAFQQSEFDRKRMLQIFEKAGHALNKVAYLANSAPYKGALYQTKYLRWLSRLASIQMLLHTALPTTDPPTVKRRSLSRTREPPAEQRNKIHAIYFRLTQDELIQFEPLIKRAGRSSTFFFRELILNDKPAFKEFTGFRKQIVFVVNKAGNNITQLAYVAKAAGDRGIITDDVMIKWFECLVAIETLLLAGVEHAD